MICFVTGQECIKEDCKQWNGYKVSPLCLLRKKIAHFLYGNNCMMELGQFIRFLEELDG